jgi:hypothetical protein
MDKTTKDLTGRRFGKLVALEPVGHVGKRRKIAWLCRCDCGKTKRVVGDNLVYSHTRSCGCGRVHNLAGKRFGKLVVVRMCPHATYDRVHWVCRCDCGKEKTVRAASLVAGDKSVATRSCGCMSMRERPGCASPHWQGYGDIPKSYFTRLKQRAKVSGSRVGITMKDAWLKFLSQRRKCALSGTPLTIGSAAKPGNASLDRIDSMHGYVPGNIQWVDKRVNTMKMALPETEFIQLCRLVYLHTKK